MRHGWPILSTFLSPHRCLHRSPTIRIDGECSHVELSTVLECGGPGFACPCRGISPPRLSAKIVQVVGGHFVHGSFRLLFLFLPSTHSLIKRARLLFPPQSCQLHTHSLHLHLHNLLLCRHLIYSREKKETDLSTYDIRVTNPLDLGTPRISPTTSIHQHPSLPTATRPTRHSNNGSPFCSSFALPYNRCLFRRQAHTRYITLSPLQLQHQL
jgi:hypothetical protein